jgi:hypothetical protein
MDKFVIKTPRKESVATAPDNDKLLKRKSLAEKDKQYEKKRKRELQQTWLINFPWLRYKETLDNKISFERSVVFCYCICCIEKLFISFYFSLINLSKSPVHIPCALFTFVNALHLTSLVF